MKRMFFLLSVSILMMLAVSASAAEKGVSHADFEYLQMEPLTLPIISVKGVTQQVSLLVSLEIDYGQSEEITIYKPRLADAYLQDLYGALGAGYGMMSGNVIDVRQIKQRLLAVTDKVLGPDRKVREVLLQVVQQRPM